jgi:sulfatase maturation enzyme AslB (radical SAM superfamily)
VFKIKEYKKLNSFAELNIKNDSDNKIFFDLLKKKIDEEQNIKNLDINQKKILEKVKKDLSGKKTNDDIRFSLSKHVIEEIKTLEDQEIPLYLVHRYRYEIYPQLNILDNYPPYLQIEPSSICNFRCVFCFETDKSFTDKKKGFMGTMKLDLFKKIIDQAENNIEFLSIASRGEPLVCKEIVPMFKYTEGKFLNLKLNTNASLLNENSCHAILSGGVKTVVFSADAADAKLYSKLRVNGDLNKVLKNIELFKKIKDTHYSRSKIITRVSGVKVNEKQNINSMVKLWGDLVDQVAFVDYNPWENVYESKRNQIKKPCSDLWRRMFIWWDGKVNPCDTDYKSLLSPGKFGDLDIKNIWNSDSYNKLRKNHINQLREKLHPCSNCVVV